MSTLDILTDIAQVAAVLATPALSAADTAALLLLQKLTVTQQRDIARFVDANRHQKDVKHLMYNQWCAECMELMASTTLANHEKQSLVVALYHQMSASESNGFDASFDIEGMIEFVWNNANNQYSLKVNKKGCFSWLPCASVKVDYNTKTKGPEITLTPLNSALAPIVISPRSNRDLSPSPISAVAPPNSSTSQ